MLHTVLNKSWVLHRTKKHMYGHLPPISQSIQVRPTRYAGHCWRSKDNLISEVLQSTEHMNTWNDNYIICFNVWFLSGIRYVSMEPNEWFELLLLELRKQSKAAFIFTDETECNFYLDSTRFHEFWWPSLAIWHRKFCWSVVVVMTFWNFH